MKLSPEAQDAVDLNNEIEFHKKASDPRQMQPWVPKIELHERNLTRWLMELRDLRAKQKAMVEASRCMDRYGDHLKAENAALKKALLEKELDAEADLWSKRIAAGLTKSGDILEVGRLNELLASTKAQCERYRGEIKILLEKNVALANVIADMRMDLKARE